MEKKTVNGSTPSPSISRQNITENSVHGSPLGTRTFSALPETVPQQNHANHIPEKGNLCTTPSKTRSHHREHQKDSEKETTKRDHSKSRSKAEKEKKSLIKTPSLEPLAEPQKSEGSVRILADELKLGETPPSDGSPSFSRSKSKKLKNRMRTAHKSIDFSGDSRLNSIQSNSSNIVVSLSVGMCERPSPVPSPSHSSSSSPLLRPNENLCPQSTPSYAPPPGIPPLPLPASMSPYCSPLVNAQTKTSNAFPVRLSAPPPINPSPTSNLDSDKEKEKEDTINVIFPPPPIRKMMLDEESVVQSPTSNSPNNYFAPPINKIVSETQPLKIDLFEPQVINLNETLTTSNEPFQKSLLRSRMRPPPISSTSMNTPTENAAFSLSGDPLSANLMNSGKLSELNFTSSGTQLYSRYNSLNFGIKGPFEVPGVPHSSTPNTEASISTLSIATNTNSSVLAFSLVNAHSPSVVSPTSASGSYSNTIFSPKERSPVTVNTNVLFNDDRSNLKAIIRTKFSFSFFRHYVLTTFPKLGPDVEFVKKAEEFFDDPTIAKAQDIIDHFLSSNADQKVNTKGKAKKVSDEIAQNRIPIKAMHEICDLCYERLLSNNYYSEFLKSHPHYANMIELLLNQEKARIALREERERKNFLEKEPETFKRRSNTSQQQQQKVNMMISESEAKGELIQIVIPPPEIPKDRSRTPSELYNIITHSNHKPIEYEKEKDNRSESEGKDEIRSIRLTENEIPESLHAQKLINRLSDKIRLRHLDTPEIPDEFLSTCENIEIRKSPITLNDSDSIPTFKKHFSSSTELQPYAVTASTEDDEENRKLSEEIKKKYVEEFINHDRDHKRSRRDRDREKATHPNVRHRSTSFSIESSDEINRKRNTQLRQLVDNERKHSQRKKRISTRKPKEMEDLPQRTQTNATSQLNDLRTFSRVSDFLIDWRDLEIEDEAIGIGSAARVYRGKWRYQEVCVKILKDKGDPTMVNDFKKEIECLMTVRSPHFVFFHGAILEPLVCIVEEYCSNRSLFSYLNRDDIRFSFSSVFNLAIDAAKGLASMHGWKPQMLHRDFKSLNLLLTENLHLKLTDFGLSRSADDLSSLFAMRGTYAYCAPELTKSIPYTDRSDIYSFGIVLWEMVNRCIKGFYQTPYYERTFRSEFQIVFLVASEGMRPTIPESCPYELSVLIHSLWHKDPKQRPDIIATIKMLETVKNLHYAQNKKKWKKLCPDNQ